MTPAPLSARYEAVLSDVDRTAPSPTDARAPVTLLPVAAAPAAPTKVQSGSNLRKRQHVVGVRLDETELKDLVARADDKKLSIGAFLRMCSLETAGPRARRGRPVDRELLARANADLNRIGNNLNQIARAMNRGRDAEPQEIVSTTDELRQALAMLRQALGYDRQG